MNITDIVITENIYWDNNNFAKPVFTRAQSLVNTWCSTDDLRLFLLKEQKELLRQSEYYSSVPKVYHENVALSCEYQANACALMLDKIR